MKFRTIQPFASVTEHLQTAESAEAEHVGGRLKIGVTDVNINTVSAVIEEDCHSSIQKLAGDLHILRM